MQYSLVAAVIILSFLLPATAIFCFLKGAEVYQNAFQAGLETKKGKTPSKDNKVIKPKKEVKAITNTVNMDKMEKLFSNLERYDGTSTGQVEIK